MNGENGTNLRATADELTKEAKCTPVDGFATPSSSSRVTSLHYKIFDDPMELDVVVVAPASELNEVLAGPGGVVVIHLDGERTHGSLQSDLWRPSI